MKILSLEHKGALYAIISGLLYGLLGYFGVTLISSGMSIPNMAFWRFFISTFLILLILIPNFKNNIEIFKRNYKIIFYGMLFYSPSTLIYFVASNYIGTGLAMVIFFTYPAIVILYNVFYYNEKIESIYYFGFLLIFIGMMLLADLHELKLDILGIFFGIVSAIFYGLYIIASKKISISAEISTFSVSFGCMITSLIFAVFDQSFFIPQGIGSWSNILAIALICTTVPMLLLLQALKYISSAQASILSVLEPVFVVIFGIILLGEKITVNQVIGTIIILSGAIITLLPKKRKFSI